MRVAKLVGGTGTTTTYAYDGQMGFEDQDTTGAGTKVTDYGIGARGIDYIASNNGTTTNVGFPCYDSHGNMAACLFRGANATYTLGNQRSYDAWGNVREGASTGDPKGRYCAQLGHKTDDESGLAYMRARYCDPQAGRFLVSDPHQNGSNWFIYCRNNPVGLFDFSGYSEGSWPQENQNNFEFWLVSGIVCFGLALGIMMQLFPPPGTAATLVAATLLLGAAACFAAAFACVPGASLTGATCLTVPPTFLAIAAGIASALRPARAAGIATATIIGFAVYDTVLLGLLIEIANGT